MENGKDLSGMGAEEILMTSQDKLKSVINTLEMLDDYLRDNCRSEESCKATSILYNVIPQLEEIHQDNEKVIEML